MLRLLLLQLLLLLLLRRRRRRRRLPPLLPVLLLPEIAKTTGLSVASAALAATAAMGLLQLRSRSKSCNMLLEQILLLCHNHRRLHLLLGEKAVGRLARIDGQAGDLLVELAARSGDMLTKIFQLNLDQILDLPMELLHIIDVVFVFVDTLVELGATGDLMHGMIQNLQNRSKVFMHLRQNLFLRSLLL